MKKRQQLAEFNLKAGQWLYNLFLIQLYFILYSFKGFLVIGIFPAIGSTFNIFYQWFQFDRYDLNIKKEFSIYYRENLWETNRFGYLLTFSGLLLIFDLYISAQFIQSFIPHLLLIVLLSGWLILTLYFFSVYARYQLIGMAYLKQTFFVALASISQTLATLLSLVLLLYLFTYVPFLLLFFGVPLICGPVAWFTLQGINKAEEKKHAQKNEGA